MPPNKNAIVIGAGFAGLSTACYLAKAGWSVTVIEKNISPGGRARKLEAAGFRFDMGPSWYWMPEVFENFFAHFGKQVSDYYALQKLDPAYTIYFEDASFEIPANYESFKNLLETIEPGAAKSVDVYLKDAAFKYQIAMGKMVYQPGVSVFECLDSDIVNNFFRLNLFQSIKKHIAQHFKHPFIQTLFEFPVLFLGALPENTPALYSFMNHAAIKGGTWYPEKGMYCIVEAMYQLALEIGVHFKMGEEVKHIEVIDGFARKVQATVLASQEQKEYDCDVLVGAGDYHHMETNLLDKQYQSYSTYYWGKRVMAPSALIFYLGLNKKIPGLTHHTLFFDTDFTVHSNEIYTKPAWPKNPLFYVGAPSVTDATVAPNGCENLFILIPIAAGLKGDEEVVREHYFKIILERMERKWGVPLENTIRYKKSYAVSDFEKDYFAFKGNAYGLANTLSQTAYLKPKLKSKKLKNLYYAGQLTVPGPGVPPCLISGAIVAGLIQKENSK